MVSPAERERKRRVQAVRRKEKPWVQWYRSTAWRRERTRFLDEHPWCEECRDAPAAIIDHIKPHRGNPDVFWDRRNWRPMCKSCHDSHTARRGGGFGNRESDKPAPGCGLDGLPLVKRDHW